MNLPTPVVTTTLPAPHRARVMRWLHGSLALCALAAAASAQAGVIYGTTAEAMAWVFGSTTVRTAGRRTTLCGQ